jgi:hypothetical protein
MMAVAMKRLIRRLLRRCGVPFSSLICAEYSKTICLDTKWQARITVQQKLVFLDMPEDGDLRDTCPLESGVTIEGFRRQSPDSVEIGRRRLGRNAIAVEWRPRAAVTPYAIYEHEHSWTPHGSVDQAAMWTEFQCEARTGTVLLEMVTPQEFSTAVIFERPRWTLLNTERRLVKYAIKQLEAGAPRPEILQNGQRLEWRILGPRKNVRYMCVAFHHNGVLLWKDRMKKASFAGGIRQLVARFTSR